MLRTRLGIYTGDFDINKPITLDGGEFPGLWSQTVQGSRESWDERVWAELQSVNMLAAILLVLGCISTLSSAQYGIWGVRPDGNCIDPTGQNGQCITIQQCPTLLDLLRQKPLTQKTAQFLREAQCGFEGRYPKVCCSQTGGSPNIEDRPGSNDNGSGRPTGQTGNEDGKKPANQIQSGTSNHPNLRLLPIAECGFDTSDKIWATGAKKFLCSGAIITKRYILTAAHCLHRIDVRGNTLTMIRLGEFDTTTNPDCEKDLDTGKEVCAPEPQDMKAERIIIHPQYSPRSINKWNDIGLIRVSQDIKFTGM
ncbi:hypothetical protein C0J52_09760 [Blattella germanica]|nr:hypothetical protein C0J52_09760 [Blattella germanica]